MSIWGKVKHAAKHVANKVADAVAGVSGVGTAIDGLDKVETNQLPGESTDPEQDANDGGDR